MKVRIKATGKIVYIERNLDNCRGGYVASDGRIYNACDLELIVDEDPDYWTRLEHQYAGMAMQGILSNQDYCKLFLGGNRAGSFAEDISRCASDFAHALVEKYKEKEEM